MNNLSDAEKAAIARLLQTDAIKLLMGAEEWDLTEDEELLIWDVINRLEHPGISVIPKRIPIK